jgi:thioredoxin-related protein
MNIRSRKNQLLLMVPSLLLSFMLLGACAPEEGGSSKESVNWLSPKEAYARIQANPGNNKKVMVDLYTDWCGWCKKMDKTTFENEKVIQELNEHFYAVKFNAESKEGFKLGKQKLDFKSDQGRRGVHEFAIKYGAKKGKLAYPTIIFFNERFQKIQAIQSYLKKNQLLPILTFMGEDYYKEMKWKTFRKKYDQGKI